MRIRRDVPAVACGSALAVLVGCNLGVPAENYVIPPEAGTLGPLAAAELDGRPGIDFYAENHSVGYALARNDGEGNYTIDLVASELPQYASTSPPALGDVDGDGDVDSVTTGVQGPDPVTGDVTGMTLRLNDGEGHFGAATYLEPALDTRGWGFDPQLHDLDGDGDLDVVASASNGHYSYGASTLYAWPNVGGEFSSPIALGDPGEINGRFAVGDVDGDSHLDIVEANGTMEGTSGLALGLGDGAFGFAFEPVAGCPTADLSRERAVLGDLDDDGDLDVVAGSYTGRANPPSNVCILLNDGDGGFTPSNITDGELWGGTALADFDGDGHLDIALARVVLFGDGDGTFPRRRALDAGFDALAADVDGDGRPDLAYAHGDTLTVMRNGL